MWHPQSCPAPMQAFSTQPDGRPPAEALGDMVAWYLHSTWIAAYILSLLARPYGPGGRDPSAPRRPRAPDSDCAFDCAYQLGGQPVAYEVWIKQACHGTERLHKVILDTEEACYTVVRVCCCHCST